MIEAIDEAKNRIKCNEDLHIVNEKLKIFGETNISDSLKKISNELFPYEKKYMPCYDKDCEVLICTVGMREQPIILSVLSIKPRQCILLHTKKSLETVYKIEDDPDIKKLEINFEMVEISEVDAAENYEVIKTQVLKKLKNLTTVRVDPTGGRKIMGTVVGTFAFFYRIPMVYLHAEEKMGINIPFTGKIEDIDNPYEYFGDIELSLIKKSFDNYDFSTVLDICEKLRTTVKDLNIDGLLGIIQDITTVYRDWDMFMHSRFYMDQTGQKEYISLSSRLETAMNDIVRFRKGLKTDIIDKGILEKNIDFLKMLENNWKNKKNICDKYRLIDLYLNAGRRSLQNRHDDATARLYRCIEMCSTIELGKYGIDDPSEPKYEVFADKLKIDMSKIESIYRDKGRTIPVRLALDDQMTLLSLVNNNVIVACYKRMKEEKIEKKTECDSLMEKRNRSILAHGTNPISKEDYERIESTVIGMIRAAVGNEDFSTLSKQAKFPKLNLI